MIPILPDRAESFGIPVYMPSSFVHLPLPRFPSEMEVSRVVALQRSIIEQAGFRPGVYSSVDEGTLRMAETVYNGFMDALIEELAELDGTALCVSLYERSEEFLGNINKFRYESIPEILLVGRADATLERQRIWARLSQYTIPMRWLIEICVKCCQATGTKVSPSRLDYLIEFARRIVEWDTAWDSIYHGVMSHEINIGPSFGVSVTPTNRTFAAIGAYQMDTVPWRVDEDRDWMNNVFQARTESANWTFEGSFDRIDRDPELGPLSRAMEKELGYSLTDMLRYSGGLQDFLQATEYLKVSPKSEFIQFMSREWKLSPERFEMILADHALSRELISGFSLDQLRPTENAGRDTRLVRRPVVSLEGFGPTPLFLYGVETLETSFRLFVHRFTKGQIKLHRMSNSGPVKGAIGKIQTNLGDAFRDEIAEKCKLANHHAVKEKGRAGTERIPKGFGFGPVDIFVVDRRFSRFILAEAKDVSEHMVVPAEVRDELLEFKKYVDKLERQAEWFRDRVEALKSEFGIAPEEDYTVEGVIIVNYPRLWMYDNQEQLPVVADKHFYEILDSGERFLTAPFRG